MQQVDHFGWLPEDYTYTGATFSVAPLNDHEKALASVRDAGRITCGWFYPPLIRDSDDDSKPEGVEIHARAFTLPATHRLHVSVSSRDWWLAPFILKVFGFTKGLSLLPTDWSHFYRAAVQIGMLTDFMPTPRTVVDVCEQAHHFYRSLPDPELQRSLFGLYHWRLFGPSYEHEFERFNAQYTVLDGVFSLMQRVGRYTSRVTHAERAMALCTMFDIPTPEWARCDPKTNQCPLSRLRNEFIHEGLYGGEPIGFASPKGALENIELELTNLNTRLLMAILGIRNDYVTSAVNTRQVFEVDVC